MTEQPQTSGERPLAPADQPPSLGPAGSLGTGLPPPQPSGMQLPELPPAAQAALSSAADTIEAKPEIAVGGAFAGGLVLAMILKRLAR